MDIARLDLETGDPASAEHRARQAADEFGKAKDPDSKASAEVLLSRALLVQQKKEEAQNVIGDAKKLAVHGSRATQIAVALVEAEAETALGKPAEAGRLLRRIVGDCRQAGFLSDELDARMVLAEAEIKTGNVAGGRAELRSLARDAQAKGFLLIARKANTARNPHTRQPE